jgi:hypothetical protein
MRESQVPKKLCSVFCDWSVRHLRDIGLAGYTGCDNYSSPPNGGYDTNSYLNRRHTSYCPDCIGSQPIPCLLLESVGFSGDRRSGVTRALEQRECSKADLEQAARLFDERGVSHGEIEDLTAALGIYVLAFRDPDNIQMELTAPGK